MKQSHPAKEGTPPSVEYLLKQQIASVLFNTGSNSPVAPTRAGYNPNTQSWRGENVEKENVEEVAERWNIY